MSNKIHLEKESPEVTSHLVIEGCNFHFHKSRYPYGNHTPKIEAFRLIPCLGSNEKECCKTILDGEFLDVLHYGWIKNKNSSKMYEIAERFCVETADDYKMLYGKDE